jgi:NAD(P)H-nitrite reductase large subunit
MAEIEEPVVCELTPLNTKATENYVVCKCNNVTYFDILDAIHQQSNASDLLSIFEKVKDTTKCSSGCGGCYEKVLAIISEAMSGN